MIHRIQSEHGSFSLLWSGVKTFEVQPNDRPYKVKDILVSVEFDPVTKLYSGREISFAITYVLDDPQFCKKGYVVLSLSELTRQVLGYFPQIKFEK